MTQIHGKEGARRVLLFAARLQQRCRTRRSAGSVLRNTRRRAREIKRLRALRALRRGIVALGLVAAVRPQELGVLGHGPADPAQEVDSDLAVLLGLAPPRKHIRLAFLPRPPHPPHAPPTSVKIG